ncbi:uncharacterized protein LOC128174173 [Crassostrea angulata]|uniref:uncharacterized protein LOC128174173 n=1 Tax=Magallana angulata TaxID=2784310 RepID=UPI0022B0C0F0|nr:uncharacterized protein LOC128174173 [Crassostrea angulata]
MRISLSWGTLRLVFDEWRKSLNENDEVISELALLIVEDVNNWLTRFIVEVRKLNGDFYPPKSLYLLITGILRGISEQGNTNNFMSETNDRFLKVWKTLDAQMKLLTAKLG